MRPHSNAKVAQVRQLIENSTLTYIEIARRTGVGTSSLSRWARDQNWTRPPGAPVATHTIPDERASPRLKSRRLTRRILALCERYVRELEAAPEIDGEQLAWALEMLKSAKLEQKRKLPRNWKQMNRKNFLKWMNEG
jgi:transposase-like protein